MDLGAVQRWKAQITHLLQQSFLRWLSFFLLHTENTAHQRFLEGLGDLGLRVLSQVQALRCDHVGQNEGIFGGKNKSDVFSHPVYTQWVITF